MTALAAPPLGGGRGAAWPGRPPPRRPGPAAWDGPLDRLPGVGTGVAARAAALGLRTVGDLLQHLPFRYERFDDTRSLARDVPVGSETTLRVRLESISVRPTRRRRLRIVRAKVTDESGPLWASWFNQEHLARMLKPGDELLLRGTLRAGSPPELTVKSHEILGRGASEGLHTTGLVPVYAGTEALPARRIREMVDAARPLAAAAPEALPAWLRHRLSLPAIADALIAVHFPRSRGEARRGRRRLVIEELLVLQLGLLALRRREGERRRGIRLVPTGALSGAVRQALPFELTPEQVRVAGRIGRDLRDDRPMRRLLQGEVGSGKTVVAALAICHAVEAGAQAAVLAPTETLAEQHVATLSDLLRPAGVEPVLITGRVPRAERERRQVALATGTASLAVGTQALLSGGIEFSRLGLVVVDEQHRFGVDQRQALSARVEGTGGVAHLLYMTATPIPRTLALTAYGDLAVSTIRRRPPGRVPVETRWVREEDREEAYESLRSELRAGRQAYVICPLVEEGEDAEARAATSEVERLAAGPLAGFSVGLAHGAQRLDDKREAMRRFGEGDTDALVATTVVEVGIDVPNATVILIEDAHRFGLAQLHQLRGRVGRGESPGLCLLLGDPAGEDGARRLEALTQTSDGFRLAELDLEIRGEGSILGVRQAGPTDLRFARLARDRRELAEARYAARRVMADDPTLSREEHRLLRAAVMERFVDVPRLLDG